MSKSIDRSEIVALFSKFNSDQWGVKSVRKEDAINYESTVKPLNEYFSDWPGDSRSTHEMLIILRDLRDQKTEGRLKKPESYLTAYKRLRKELIRVEKLIAHLSSKTFNDERGFSFTSRELLHLQESLNEHLNQLDENICLDMRHLQTADKVKEVEKKIHGLETIGRKKKFHRDALIADALERIMSTKDVTLYRASRELVTLLKYVDIERGALSDSLQVERIYKRFNRGKNSQKNRKK